MVLCGGRSRRMGRDKALVPVDGRPMARRVADALLAAGASEVVAAGGDAARLAALGLATRADSHPGGGPVPALLDALEAARTELLLVVACDLLAPDPGAMAAVVDALAAAPGRTVAVPLVGGVRQWHHAAWDRSARPALLRSCATGARSVHGAVAASGLGVLEVGGVAAAAVADADTPEDLTAGPEPGPTREREGGHPGPG